MMDNCIVSASDARRTLWAFQPFCSTRQVCGMECGVPGLECIVQDGGVTISNENYVRGLALSMLFTDAQRPSTDFGFRPGDRKGHWTDTFTQSGVGSLIRNIPTDLSINQTTAMVASFAQSTLNKLVERGVATRVEVNAEYQGGGVVNLTARIFANAGNVTFLDANISRVEKDWVWNV